MSNPHVLVDMYRVQKQTFNATEVDYYVAEVSEKGLFLSPKHEDPFGAVEYGPDEKTAKDNLREELKLCGFSKKQIEYRRI